jgi:hypothetical protein
MSPEELMHKVHRMIDSCFAEGMKPDDVVREIEKYIASIES